MSSIVKMLLIWVPIFLTFIFVFTICLGRIFLSENLEKSLRWFSTYSQGLLKQNEIEIGANLTQQQAEDIRKRSIKALEKAPLSFLPFVQLGEVGIILKQKNNTRNLFVETKNRNIRNRRALMGLINIDVLDGNFDEVIRNLDILLTLKNSKENFASLHQALYTLSTDSIARESINGFLLNRPSWGHKYLQNQITFMTDDNIDQVDKSLNLYFENTKNNDEDYKLQKQYLLSLSSLKKIEKAFAYWKRISSYDESTDGKFTVYNPNFTKLPELAPFNWLEVDQPKYFSEIDSDGGLYASYADKQLQVLTEQILQLIPNSSYELSVNANWTYRERQGLFFWIVTCLNNGQIIVQVDLDNDAKRNSENSYGFRVPTECIHQSIQLMAKPGQYSQRIWSRTQSIAIEPTR